MKKLKNINYKLSLLNNKIFNFFYSKNYKYNIAILSCDKWLGKVKEDVLLKIELNKVGARATIISWQNKNINFKDFDAIIIRSIWGYQDYINDFNDWLDLIKKNNIFIINDLDIICNNFDKQKQFNILDNSSIPHIKTFFLKEKNITSTIKDEILNIKTKYFNNKSIVIKPIISGSGNNTFILGDEKRQNTIDFKNIDKTFNKIISEKNNGLIIQPFIEEIDNGEYSLIYINKNLSHAVLRFPSIFNKKEGSKIIPISDLDKNLIDLGNKVSLIKEYNNALYMRVDAVKVNDEYKIMEIELLEPQLFFYYINDKKERICKTKYFAEQIIKKIN